MSNTLNGLNLTAISQETAKTLLPKLAGLNFFNLNLSNDIADRGEAVVSRVVNAYTAADLSSGYVSAAAATSTVSIQVTLDSFSGVVLGFSDLEVSKSSIDLQQMVYQPMANAAAKAIYGSIFGLIKATVFTTVATVASAAFDSDTLSDVAAALNKNFVPDSPRAIFMNSDVANALRKDTSIKAAYAFGSNGTIVDGSLSKVMGFDIMEFSWLPANSENLNAFACGPQGIAFAARRVAEPTNWYGQVENITVADVPLQLRMWYDGNTGTHYLSMGILYGVKAAVTNNINVIHSA
jgi:hypothetical protein